MCPTSLHTTRTTDYSTEDADEAGRTHAAMEENTDTSVGSHCSFYCLLGEVGSDRYDEADRDEGDRGREPCHGWCSDRHGHPGRPERSPC